MNESNQRDADAIRSDIDQTRQRMDETMDALGNRLQPRHLFDEFLGYVRGESADGETRMTHLREKVTHSCESAMHSVVNTVKQNPIPALLIGAGVGWMIYESMRDKSPRAGSDGHYYGFDREGDQLAYDPDVHYDRPLEYPAGLQAQSESKLGHMKDAIADKAHSATDAVKSKLSHAGEAVREKAGALKERAGQMTARMRDGTREAYARTRERVVTTADQRPLEVGLVALAAGLLVGLALPTPSAVDRTVGPTADRLRDRARQGGADVLEKGKRVARAAVDAVKHEADAQGLTPERLRNQAATIAERGVEAGKQTAQQEGLAPDRNPSGSPLNDPSQARPAV